MLAAPEVEIWGLVWAQDHGEVPPSVHRLTGDLRVPSSLLHNLETAQPDIVFHLAGATSVAESWRQPDLPFHINALGTLHLLEALRSLDLQIREGEVFAFLGPNGGGKTTLLMAIMGMPGYRVTGGRILFNGGDRTEIVQIFYLYRKVFQELP